MKAAATATWIGCLAQLVPALPGAAAAQAVAKPRVVVLTDVSNEPDDEESLVRLLVYANEFDLEGLIATTSTHLRKGPREDLLRRDIDAYENVRPNLGKHASGYPTADQLRAVTMTGILTRGSRCFGCF